MTITDRRRALMGAAKKPKILYQWTAEDGLDALTYDGTNTTSPYISGDYLVVPSGPSFKTKGVWSKNALSFTGSFTETIKYAGAQTSTESYYEIHFHAYFVGRSIDFAWLAGGDQTPTWRIKKNTINIADIIGRTFTEDGKVKICYDATNSIIKFYHNDDLIYSDSGSANETTYQRILLLASRNNTTTKIESILVEEGIT